MLLLALIGASSLAYVQSSNATAVAAPVSTLYETVHYIFDEAKLLSYEDVKEMVVCAMTKNLGSRTFRRVLMALAGEINTHERPIYTKTVVPRITGLENKMNKLVHSLAAMYGFSGESANKYTKLIRPMQVSSIIAAALEGAKRENNTKQYEEIEKLVAELNKTSPHHHESPISSIHHGKIAGNHPQKHHNATEAEHQLHNGTGHGHHLPSGNFHVELPPDLHHRSSDPTKGTHTISNHTQSINGTINEEHHG